MAECYKEAASIVCFSRLSKRLGLPSEGLTLVHGYPTLTNGPGKGDRYGHAWVEYTGEHVVMCYDPLAERHVPAALYYLAGQIDRDLCQRYDAHGARLQMLNHEHYGPWENVPEDAVFSNDVL